MKRGMEPFLVLNRTISSKSVSLSLSLSLSLSFSPNSNTSANTVYLLIG